MPKTVRAPRGAPAGDAPRLLQGNWAALCDQVAAELSALGAGRLPDGKEVPPSVAVLLFSTSEKESRRGGMAGLDMRRALEAQGLRVYNPRNKTAGRRGSPVHSLAALLSYLIDPVTIAPAGSGGRPVMVWASCGDAAKSAFAVTAPPTFPVAARACHDPEGIPWQHRWHPGTRPGDRGPAALPRSDPHRPGQCHRGVPGRARKSAAAHPEWPHRPPADLPAVPRCRVHPGPVPGGSVYQAARGQCRPHPSLASPARPGHGPDPGH